MNDESSNESVQQLRERVAAEPSDRGLRLQLGMALYHSGDPGGIRDAIPELLRARRHPEHREAATYLLHRLMNTCTEPGALDLAERLRNALGGDDGSADSGSTPSPNRPILPLNQSAAKQLPDDYKQSA